MKTGGAVLSDTAEDLCGGKGDVHTDTCADNQPSQRMQAEVCAGEEVDGCGKCGGGCVECGSVAIC